MLELHWKDICPQGEAIHLARVAAPQPEPWRKHRHDFFECFLVEAGRGWHLVGDGKTRLETGQLVFIRPEHVHGFRASARDGLVLTNVAVEAPAVRRFRARHGHLLDALGCWAPDRPPRTQAMSVPQRERCLELVADVAAGERDALDGDYFLAGLLRLLRPGHDAPHADLPEWMREALPLAAEPEHLREGVPRLVRLCRRSPEHVARSFRKHLGQTPTQWLTAARLRYARRLLETTDLPVTAVALECGMDNLSHFHRRFRQYTGDTPLNYRRRAGLSVAGRGR
ncbi:MAG: AraC family transcriptional regulator [Phycisphaeraceae bacterium]